METLWLLDDIDNCLDPAQVSRGFIVFEIADDVDLTTSTLVLKEIWKMSARVSLGTVSVVNEAP